MYLTVASIATMRHCSKLLYVNCMHHTQKTNLYSYRGIKTIKRKLQYMYTILYHYSFLGLLNGYTQILQLQHPVKWLYMCHYSLHSPCLLTQNKINNLYENVNLDLCEEILQFLPPMYSLLSLVMKICLN